MGRFYGAVGYVSMQETVPDVHRPVYTERNYYGDIQKYSRRLEGTNVINDGISVVNTISIIADPFAYEHFSDIRYVKWMKQTWKVTSVEVDRPRLLLTLGGLYHEDETGA